MRLQSLKVRLLDFVLVMVIVAGGLVAWRTGQERSRLSAEYRRLTHKTGDLSVEDPLRVYVRAISTSDPRSFAWRVYLPPNYTFNLRRHPGAGSGTSTSASAREFIARVRFREDDQGRWRIYTRMAGGSTLTGVGSQQRHGDFIRDHWDRIRIEQLGASGVVSVGADEVGVLLDLRLPPDLEDEARKVFSNPRMTSDLPSIFRVEFGEVKPKS